MNMSWRLRIAMLSTLTISALLAAGSDPTEPLVATTPARLGASARPANRATAATFSPPPEPANFDTSRVAWPEPDRSVAAWEVPPAPPASRPGPAPPVQPVPPQAPPFPYALVGRFEDDKGSSALLSNALKTIAVNRGDVVDGQWRIEAILPGRLDVIWVPDGLRQTVTYRPS